MHAFKKNIVTGADLLAPHGADFTVDHDFAVLDDLFGHAAAFYQIFKLQKNGVESE